MNKAKQILEEALSYKNCGGLIEENSRLEDIILYAINQALRQPDVIKPVCPDCDSEREPNPPLQQADCYVPLPHDLKLLEKIWFGRNPCHETNSNSGEDMFWRTVACVIDDYIGMMKVFL